MPRRETLNWYETGLSVQERKGRGHFSTPPLLIHKILDACGYIENADLAQLKVLDPACGSGNFLVEAASRMIASGRQRGIEPTEILASLQRNLWGIDPDPVACFLAEMQVQSCVTQELRFKRRSPLRLHIHQADGLALTWERTQRKSIDLFIANPPYLAAKNADLSAYRSPEELGQVDSYLLFLRLALQVVRPDGWIGLVLPDAVLARANATRERQQLLKEMTVHHLWHLSRVFPAYVGAVVLIAQKRPPQSLHAISWVRDKWELHENTKRPLPSFVTATVSQMLLGKQTRAELRYLLGSEQDSLIARLQIALTHVRDACTIVPLENLVSIRRGEELGKKSNLLTDVVPDEQGWYPLLRGGVDMHAYATPHGQHWIARKAIEKPLTRYLAPKLLVVKSTSTLQAALDIQGHVALQTLYLLYLKNEPITRNSMPGQNGMPGEDSMIGASPVTTILSSRSDENVYGSDRACPCHAPTGAALGDASPVGAEPGDTAPASAEPGDTSLDTLYFLLALLNSRLLQRYVYVLHTAYKLVQPQIEQRVLAQLPIPLVNPVLRQEIVERARQITLACSLATPVVELKQQITLLCEEQEGAICALYEEAIQKADKGVD